jgi:hypothetical protein
MIRLRLKKQKISNLKGQMELPLSRPLEQDRNFHLGGRSFYFFDFDDNVVYLTTPIVIFDKKNGEEKLLSSGEWANFHHTIGSEGPFKDYIIDYDDDKGSFRYFRDKQLSFIDKISRRKQVFLTDIEQAINQHNYSWKAPSWNCFYHAIYNKRPISVITARGHYQETIKKGIQLLVDQGHLPHAPNYLSIFPVTNPDVRKTKLQDPELTKSVATLKKTAIRLSVEKAIQKYGMSPYHRFGMSDDDPKNVELITEELKSLKKDYPEMSFYVIQTFRDYYEKTEVIASNIPKRPLLETSQLSLI